MKSLVAVLILATFIVRIEAAPFYERQIATFVRDFFLSAGQMDQDDDDSSDSADHSTKTNVPFQFPDDPFPSNEDEIITTSTISSTAVPEGREKKMLVFFKGDKKEDAKRRGKRDSDDGSKSAKKKLNREEVSRILGQLRNNMKGKPMRMRTVLDELDAIPGGFELSELLNNSALMAIREFFRQIFSSFA